MYKLVTFAGYDQQTGPHLFPIEPDREQTIGHIKMARPLPPKVEHYIRTAKPIPGKTQLLIDALGASEYFGTNSNGDAFPEAGLRHEGADYGYRTFMYYGYPYKHHCFPAGTLVTMGDGERRPIENIEKGDCVLTSQGVRTVTNTMVRPYDGAGVSIKARGRATRLLCTADHPVLVFRRSVVHCRHRYSRLTPPSDVSSSRYHGNNCVEFREGLGELKPTWIPATEIQVGDYITRARHQLGDTTLSTEFAQLIGWVAADGCLGKRGSIQFTFGKSSPKIALVSAVLEANGLHAGICERKDGLVAVSSCSKDVHERLSRYIEGKLTEKHLTEAVFELSPDTVRHVLSAYIDGDGHIGSSSNKGWLRIRSASQAMLAVLADLVEALGVPASVNWDTRPNSFVSPTNGATYHTNGSGVVCVSGQLVLEIAPHSHKAASASTNIVRRRTPLRWENLILAPVVDVEDEGLSCDVYNIEVDGAHEYVADDMLVHNCNKDPARSFGDKVTLSEYDPHMHRVLLIVRVDDSKCQDILGDLARGHYWSVSMGARVPSDRCSICNNVAKNRGEYCPHLRYQMNRILQDGRRVCAINDKPKFFDISFVTIGAEKASHVLKKVASASGGQAPSSAELGEEYYAKLSSATKKAVQKKRADIDKDVPSQPPATMTGVTPEDKSKLDDIMAAAGEVKGHEAPIPTGTLNQIAKHPLPDIMSTIAALGIDLRPQEFQRIILIKQGHAKLADTLDAKRLVFDERSPGRAPGWSRDIRWDPEALNEKVAMLLEPHISERSCYPEVLLARLERMEKVGGAEGYNRDSKWYHMTEEGRRASSGTTGMAAASGALAAGFMAFRHMFPELTKDAPSAIKTLTRHPWLLPLLVGAGVGASVGLQTSTEPRPLSPYGTGSGLDGIKHAAYHGAKTASSISPLARIGLIPLAYIYSGIQQKRWQRGARLNAVDRFIAQRPDLAGLAGFATAPTVARGVRRLTKHGSALGNLALYSIGSSSKLMPAVLAGAVLDTAIFKLIGRLAARKGNRKHGNTR